MLDRDVPPFTWDGNYDPLLRYGGNKFKEINKLRDILTGRFRIVLKISEVMSNLYVNGKPCLVRKGKFKKISVYPNTKIIKGTDMGYGGSNSYPHISFKEGECTVEIITDGFPHLQLKTYQMKIEILEFERLGK